FLAPCSGIKLAFWPHYLAIARAIGYVGFPARELAERLKGLIPEHGAKKLSAALFEVATFAGNRVMLNEKARPLCWQVLGPPPEKWDGFYRYSNGTPMPRPPGKEQPPLIPSGGPDPLMESLYRLTHADLSERLQTARQTKDREE